MGCGTSSLGEGVNVIITLFCALDGRMGVTWLRLHNGDQAEKMGIE